MTVDSEQIETTTVGTSLYFDCKPRRHFDVAKHIVVVFN
jgi:hypothetical protein